MWYRASLSGEQVAAGQIDAACRLFADAIGELADPSGVCLFATSHDALFFSPASISVVPHLIAQYRAEPSGPPDRARAALLVGQPDDWKLLPHSSH